MTSMIAAEPPGYRALMGKIEKTDGADTLEVPEMALNIGGHGQNGFAMLSKSGWDPTTNDDGTAGTLSLGDDVYLYAVPSGNGDGYTDLLASKNSTTPDGYTTSDSRKVGGFHFGRTRALADAYDSTVTLAQEIVWNSVWDLQHRPQCDPTGMVEVIPDQVWMDIYLSSEDGTAWPDTVPLSEYNATPLTGTEGYALYFDYVRLTRNARKRLPTYTEWLAGSYGVPQGATGAGGRVNTGIHTDYGFEAVSCLSIDQPSGNVYQTLDHVFDRGDSNATTNSDSWHDGDLDAGKDSANDHGDWYGGDMRVWRAGGYWSLGVEAGARCVARNIPWDVVSSGGLRAACDAL